MALRDSTVSLEPNSCLSFPLFFQLGLLHLSPFSFFPPRLLPLDASAASLDQAMLGILLIRWGRQAWLGCTPGLARTEPAQASLSS